MSRAQAYTHKGAPIRVIPLWSVPYFYPHLVAEEAAQSPKVLKQVNTPTSGAPQGNESVTPEGKTTSRS